MPKALITGVDGQDGSYLAKLLLEKGYEVVGMVWRLTPEPFLLIEDLRDDIVIMRGDLVDQSGLVDMMEKQQPDEVYNLAAQSFVPLAWRQPVLTGDITGLGVARLLDAVRLVKPQARFYQASSSEMFGKVRETPQNEQTPFHPRNPYGIAKAYAHWLVDNYRDAYGLFACSGILYNHESPHRGMNFVTRKITNTAARIKLGLANELRLGNMESRRDWGYAKDYVKAMWLMMQQDEPDDYVIGTGVTRSVRDVCETAFSYLGLEYGDYVVVDERFYRPLEPTQLVADPSKARRVLGWEPTVAFEELIRLMVEADLALVSRELT
jgi:GDPmannose 4,6-dehydratase